MLIRFILQNLPVDSSQLQLCEYWEHGQSLILYWAWELETGAGEKIESSNSNCNTRGVNGGSGDDTSVWCQHHHHHPTDWGGGGAGGTWTLYLPPLLPDIFPRSAVTPDLHYLIINATAGIPLITPSPRCVMIGPVSWSPLISRQ